jgi:hypothetical protein
MIRPPQRTCVASASSAALSSLVDFLAGHGSTKRLPLSSWGVIAQGGRLPDRSRLASALRPPTEPASPPAEAHAGVSPRSLRRSRACRSATARRRPRRRRGRSAPASPPLCGGRRSRRGLSTGSRDPTSHRPPPPAPWRAPSADRSVCSPQGRAYARAHAPARPPPADMARVYMRGLRAAAASARQPDPAFPGPPLAPGLVVVVVVVDR